MNKKEKTQRGITLIALVITIIVMLILVGVTISMAVNGGLFEYAGRAASETNKALKEEQQLAEGRINIAGQWYDSIDDYLVASGNKGPTADNLFGEWRFHDTISMDGFVFQTVSYTCGNTPGYNIGSWEENRLSCFVLLFGVPSGLLERR